MSKERLDVLLVERGLFDSREKARRSIMAGVVHVNGSREDKPGSCFDIKAEIDIKKDINPYVSRGGLKLEKALDCFGIELKGKRVLDVGASTGGFTDCMLKRGAEKVYSVDVGYGQLAWKLRNDIRVVNMERTNIRYVKPADIGESLNFATADVSFISLKLVLPPVSVILKEDGEMICLVKPQFEAGREKVGKKGVVRDPEVHIEVIEKVAGFAREAGFAIKGITFSPVRGPEGNIEYLMYISKNGIDISGFNSVAGNVVKESHSS